MSAQINDGGPAFPLTESRNSGGTCYVGDSCARIEARGGMALRDWFAGQALAGALASPCDSGGDTYAEKRSNIVRVCYEYADAMLCARKEAAK